MKYKLTFVKNLQSFKTKWKIDFQNLKTQSLLKTHNVDFDNIILFCNNKKHQMFIKSNSSSWLQFPTRLIEQNLTELSFTDDNQWCSTKNKQTKKSSDTWQNQSGPAATCHRSDQIWAKLQESHSRVPVGCVWSWPHGPISCAGSERSSSSALSVSSYLRLSLFTASGALADWCEPQPPPWPQLHNHQQLSPCICPPACLWRKRESAGLHSAQIPPSADSVNIQTHILLHKHEVIKRQSVHAQPRQRIVQHILGLMAAQK